MAKKQYMTPKAIDFSIEGMTGIGAGSCKDGGSFTPDCNDGFAPTTGCNPAGMIPYMPGENCDGGPSAVDVCFAGNGARITECNDGGSAQFTCTIGQDDSLVCNDGPTNNICYIGSTQSAPGS